MKPIFAIDPGPEKSAYVEYHPNWISTPLISWSDQVDNLKLLRFLAVVVRDRIGVIEVIQSYRLRVGKDVFETCEWVGDFRNEWRQRGKGELGRLTKPEVSYHLCNRRNAVKADLRGALYQRFGDGSRRSAMGVKKEPGPLYGLTGDHVWDALALAVTWHEQNGTETEDE